ncbi:MAG: hypothetical protein WB616_17365 [Candidatus Sulfotelmatobacter sp.]
MRWIGLLRSDYPSRLSRQSSAALTSTRSGDYLDEMFTLHPSPTETAARSLRVAVVCVVIIAFFFFAIAFVFLFVFFLVRLLSKEDNRQATNQKGPTQGILELFCACSMVRLVPVPFSKCSVQ